MDPDDDAFEHILYGATPERGHFAVNGVERAAKEVFGVTPALLAQIALCPMAAVEFASAWAAIDRFISADDRTCTSMARSTTRRR